jgi:transposase-like protein
MCDTKESAFQYSASIFHCSYLELHISDQAKYYQNTWLLLLHFWASGIMRSVHHLQIILKERLNPYAKAVNFTFDNSNR